MGQHHLYRYSLSITTDDLAVVYCLRALSKYSQKTGNNNIPWGGTNDRQWEKRAHSATFFFSSPDYREGFLSEATRLLPHGLWQVVSSSDETPATPQR